jgi:L-alanine-DL-glutamate epimerase-like enolase superfamily enzyme
MKTVFGGCFVKVQSIVLGQMRAPLLRPFKTALRTVTTLEELVIGIAGEDGCHGWGSVVPTPAITGDTEEKIKGDLNLLLSELQTIDVDEVWTWQQKIPSAAQASRSAVCAVDVALHDLASRRAKMPLWRWLGGAHSIRMMTNMTISVDDPDAMADCAQLAVREGFETLKVKVGLDSELDKKRVLAIRRRVGGKIRLRLDANQGWTQKEAESLIPWFCEMCGPIEFIEQPVKASDLNAMIAITRKSEVSIVADESAMTYDDARRVLDTGAANALSVKLIKAGGVSEARRILDLAYERSIPCLMSCMFEAGAGLQAAAHLASMHPSVYWVDLDSAEFLNALPYQGGIRFKGPKIAVGDSSGLDIEFNLSQA